MLRININGLQTFYGAMIKKIQMKEPDKTDSWKSCKIE
jgi:hypothetical protein